MNYYNANPVPGSGASSSALDYLPRSATATGPASYRTWQAKRRNADGTFTSEPVSAALAAQINAAPQTQYTGTTPGAAPQPGTAQAQQAQAAPLGVWLDNLDAAQAIADAWPMFDEENQGRGLFDYAIGIGLRPDLAALEMRAAVAKYLATIADELGLDLVAELDAAENAPPTGSAGFFDSAKRLVQHPLKWANNVIGEIGKGLQQLGDNVLNARKIGPLGTYFLDPLGFTLQAKLLQQVGNVLEAGSISAFDEREFSYTLATTFTATGQALVTAGPFIPQPFGTAAMLVGAASIAAGKMLRVTLDQRKGLREGRDPYAAAVEVQAEEPDAEATQAVAVPGLAEPVLMHFFHFATRGWQAAHFFDGVTWQPIEQAA